MAIEIFSIILFTIDKIEIGWYFPESLLDSGLNIGITLAN